MLRIVLSHVYSWPEVRRGGERYLHELSRALYEAGHSVQVVSTATQSHRDRVLGVPVRYFQRRAFWTRRFGELAPEVTFGAQAGLSNALRSYDVWHALGTADAAVAATVGRVRRGLTTVYTDLGIPNRSYREWRPDRRLHRFVVRHVDTYVCLSETAAAPLRTEFGREPVVIGGGVDTRRFQPGKRSPQPTVLFSGALTERRKNLALLLKAFDAVLRAEPSSRLVLSGPGDPRILLRAASPRVRERVEILPIGDPDELQQRYGSAWVTVLPSTREAFGLVLVESLACGTPVVALDGEGPGEIITEDVGVLTEPRPDHLAEAIVTAVSRATDADIAERCRNRALDFDWRLNIVPRLERVYGQSRDRYGSTP